MYELERSAVKTYRYLRLGVVGLALALGAALLIEITTGDSDGILGSISAYYYTPVTGIFVGVLVAVGFGLIAIKGREDGGEDVLLNLAGMLAPIVALVPTPISEQVYGLQPAGRSVPDELVPTVENNVAAILLLGALAVVAAYFTVPRGGPDRALALRGLAVGAAVVAAGGLWFFLGRQSFLDYGHYAAAIPMFVLLAAVAAVNALRARDRDPDEVRGLTLAQYQLVYGVLALAMAGALLLAVVMYGGQEWLDWSLPTSWLFVVEAAMLVLFTAFWIAQTVENWDFGAPPDHASAAGAPGKRGAAWRSAGTGVSA